MEKLINYILNSNNKIVLITQRSYQKEIKETLGKMKKIFDIKYKSKQEFIKDVHGEISEESIKYLHFNKGYRVEFCNTLIKNMYYLNDDNYHAHKLKDIANLKQELRDNGLIENNYLTINQYQDCEIIVYGYDDLDKLFDNCISLVSPVNYLVFKDERKYSKDVVVNSYQNVVEEVWGLASKISDMVYSGTDINKIKINAPSSEYRPVIESVFKDFDIGVNFSRSMSLYSYEIVTQFLKLLKTKEGLASQAIKATLEKIEEIYYLKNSETLDVYNRLLRIINPYVTYNKDISELLELIKYELKSNNVKPKEYKNCVEVLDIFNSNIKEDEHVFIIGFIDGDIPRIRKDNDYLEDFEKQVVGQKTSIELNKITVESILAKIDSIKNLHVSYPKKSTSRVVFVSRLIDNLKESYNSKIEDNPSAFFKDKTFSSKRDQIELAKIVDYYYLYGELDDNADDLYTRDNLSSYKTYSNKFSGIDKRHFERLMANKLNLSYTSLNDYSKCSFKFFLSRILRVKSSIRNQNSLVLGNLFHYTLEQLYKNDDFTDLDNKLTFHFHSYLDENEIDVNPYYIDRYVRHLKSVVEVLRSNDSLSNFNVFGLEKSYHLLKEVDGFEVSIRGFIDKVLSFEQNNDTYMVVIDYKTGTPYADFRTIPHGLNMQLPMYFYFIRESAEIEGLKYAGCYLQPILPKIYDKEKDKSYIEIVKSNFKLHGYTNERRSVIYNLDKNYETDSYIDKLKLKKDGDFNRYTKVLDDRMFDNLIDLVSDNVDQTIDDILNCKFSINPKSIGAKTVLQVSCAYCEFTDVCYKTQSDTEYLKEYKDLTFLEVNEDDTN